MLLGSQREGKRNYLLLFLPESDFQKRMACLAQVQFAVIRYDRHSCNEVQSRLGLGHYEIDFSEVFRAVEQIRDIGPEEVGEFQQDTEDFPLLGKFEFLDLVVEFDDFSRLDIGSFSGSGLIIDEALDALLVRRTHRYQHLSVPDGNGRIAVGYALLLCLAEDGIDPFGDGSSLVVECPSDGIKFVRCRVLDLAVTVEYGLYPGLYMREAHNRSTHPLEVGIYPVLNLVKE